MSFVYVCHCLLSKATFQENFVLLSGRENQIPDWCQLIFTVKQSSNKRLQRQFNVLRNLSHAQNSLPLATNLFSFTTNIFYIFCVHHFICPFREPVSSNLLPFLIECNFIPYTLLLKTHILLSFSNHELYFISSFCRPVNINHPKLYHFLSSQCLC